MPVSTSSYIAAINVSLPTVSGTASLAYAEIQNLKKAVKQSLPNFSSEMSAGSTELNQLVGLSGNFQAQLNTHFSDRAVTSANLQIQINNEASARGLMSANLTTRMQAMSSSVQAAINVTAPTLLGLSATAQSMIRWGGVSQYWASDTPAVSEPHLWFVI